MAWTTTNSRDLYGIERWGNRFFDINEAGSKPELIAALA